MSDETFTAHEALCVLWGWPGLVTAALLLLSVNSKSHLIRPFCMEYLKSTDLHPCSSDMCVRMYVCMSVAR